MVQKKVEKEEPINIINDLKGQNHQTTDNVNNTCS